MTETVVVTATSETVSTGQAVSTTFEQTTVEKLPIARTINSAVALAPGVTQTGPAGNTVISGAQSYENLYLVNGVVVNENLRGQPFDMFIEDALAETTVRTGAVSAEYGRFSGGVINTITKSGGNEFSGSFRTNFQNDKWTARAPDEVEQDDKTNEIFEATAGGRIWRDKIWFFAAGRNAETTASSQTYITDIRYPTALNEDRIEAKLTGAITAKHRLIGSYFQIDEEQIGNNFLSAGMDLNSLVNRTLPLEGWSFHYTGIMTSSLLIEAQYAEREFTFEDSGGTDTSFVGGTVFRDLATGGRYNAPTFCGACEDEQRSNDNWFIKGSYFLSAGDGGSHDIVAGYDTFSDIRLSDNHQSASDYQIYLLSGTNIDDDNNLYPIVGGGVTAPPAWVVWYPILGPSQGTDFETHSFYVNDSWRLNDKWSFNIGARYDKNDGADAEGKQVVDDARISPRLGISFDPKADGEWLLTANYAHYVSAIANTVADSSSAAGTPAIFAWDYFGPEVNVMGDGMDTSPSEALEIIEDWWFNVYGGAVEENWDEAWFVDIPGSTTVISDTLASPFVEEVTVGVTKRLGSRGIVRADYVHRSYQDFYADLTDMTTGQDALGNDLTFVVNNDSLLHRKYDGLQVAFQYRPFDRVNVGATWTWSHLRGNVNGETSGSGPITASVLDYPEYRESSWNSPYGALLADQRHKFRGWAIWDILAGERNHLSVSLLQNFWSGQPYSAVGDIDPTPYVTNPGYSTPPSSINYYFTDRGVFKTDDITRTDLAINYSFFVWKNYELFIQTEIQNIFNEQGVDGVLTNVDTAENDATLLPFNPFTEMPVEGINYRYDEDFGQPVEPADYQLPRRFRFSVGFRF
jgi:hypothetical protein